MHERQNIDARLQLQTQTSQTNNMFILLRASREEYDDISRANRPTPVITSYRATIL